ncbi:hypothetical protein, partial [Enterobacter quasiroggenkampii]|uniref:hypothetical protein n=1 Tax=Enterobacter quasiroggenkampii TaxID=2497436 RepID=UPI0021CED47F
IYPFRNKNQCINFYLDGFVGYYPLILANLGQPDKIFFYEEGESTYCEGVLFEKKAKPKIKSIINTLIKKALFVPKNSIDKISGFYVRDKKRLEETLSVRNDFKYDFPIQEIDEFRAIKNLSDCDKNVLKVIFFRGFDCDFSSLASKKAIVLTQPTYL